VDRELFDDVVDDPAALDVCAGARLLEALEERFDGAVVVLQERDGIHGRAVCTTDNVIAQISAARPRRAAAA
jgi:hypothetical protein